MIKVISILVAVAFAAFAVLQTRKIATVRNENAALQQQLAEATAPKPEDPSVATIDAAELKKLQDDRSELIKLRGEVTTLRREKEELQKQVARQDAATAAAAAAQKKQQEQNATAMNQVESIVNGPALTKGTVSGQLRRKLLSGEALTQTEQMLLTNLAGRGAEIEKSPADFSAFQTAYISSLLGWNNDPRSEQVSQMLLRASSVANERGFSYTAPQANAAGWSDQQKALNARATGAVQNLLTPDERAVFDKALIGVLGVDLGVTPR